MLPANGGNIKPHTDAPQKLITLVFSIVGPDVLGAKPKGKKCQAVEGLVEEAKELMDEDIDENVLDAGLIGAAQKVEHYEMAGYGTVRTWAQQLGLDHAAELLQETLDDAVKRFQLWDDPTSLR